MEPIFLFLILIFGLILGFIIKSFLPEYFKEKGKNIATKEDIGVITKEIKKAESKYLAEIEKIKSQLQVSVDNKKRLNKSADLSITNFFENCLILSNEKLSYKLAQMPSNLEYIEEYEKSVKSLFTKLILDHYRMLVYIKLNKENENILMYSSNIVEVGMDIKNSFNSEYYNVKSAFREFIEAYNAVPKNKKLANDLLDKLFDTIKQYEKIMDPKIDEFNTQFSLLHSAINEYFTK
jgi:hypothetical protein